MAAGLGDSTDIDMNESFTESSHSIFRATLIQYIHGHKIYDYITISELVELLYS